MAKKPSVSNAAPAAREGNDANQPTSTESLIAKCIQAIDADDDASAKAYATQNIQRIIAGHNFPDHAILLLYDEESISDFHADRLYAAAAAPHHLGKPILLVVHSPGGSIEPAYLISKALKRLSQNQFKVLVPRQAKSAATLLALGASEIHMGIMSQLGPIDPQFGGLPALALANALDVIADVACRFPGSTEMLAKYLTEQIPIRHLGYFQRINDSAAQYAERLLSDKSFAEDDSAASIAQHLVNYYKDHNFVIDADEATRLLGGNTIKENSPEYALSDEIFRFLDLLSLFLANREKRLIWVGDPKSEPYLWQRPNRSGSTTPRASTPR